MTYSPPERVTIPHTIGTFLEHVQLHAFCGATNPAAIAWPAANLALYVPLALDAGDTYAQFWFCPSGTAAGVVDIGVFDDAGNKLFSSLATTVSVAQAVQRVDVADFFLPRGRYWIGMAASSVTPLFRRWTCNQATEVRCFGMQQQALGAAPAAGNAWLPSAATFASPANSYIPNIGMSKLATLM